MKKKIMAAVAVLVIALVAFYNIYINQNQNALANLVLDNIEALADPGESTGDTGPGEMIDCAGWLTGSRKECMSRNDSPCTPTDCK